MLIFIVLQTYVKINENLLAVYLLSSVSYPSPKSGSKNGIHFLAIKLRATNRDFLTKN
jgi:hypothetical protein